MGGTTQNVPRGAFRDPEWSPGGRFGTEKGPPGDVLGQKRVPRGTFRDGGRFGALHREQWVVCEAEGDLLNLPPSNVWLVKGALFL